MKVDEVVLARQRYQNDGFYICPEPLIPRTSWAEP